LSQQQQQQIATEFSVEIHCGPLTMTMLVALLQESVKRLKEIQSSLIGQFEVIKPGRVSKLYLLLSKCW